MSESNKDRLEREAEEARLVASALPDDMQTAAGIQFDFYCNWINAGFTQRQALWLVGQMVGASMQQPPEVEA